MNQQLKDMLEEFLSEKRISTGGWAKPTVNDMSQLNDIIYELLLLKFELDPDGDLPITYIISDKTEEEFAPYIATTHLHNLDDKDKKAWVQTLSDLNYNLNIANDRFQTAFNIFKRIK